MTLTPPQTRELRKYISGESYNENSLKVPAAIYAVLISRKAVERCGYLQSRITPAGREYLRRV